MKLPICLPALALGAPVLAGGNGVTINEVRIDQTGSDNDEYFELAGSPQPLDGLTYLVIGDGAAGSGVIESVTDLTGASIGGSGYFVAAESTFTLGAADLTTSLGFENGDNVTHLLVDGFTGANGDDLDTDDDGVLDVTPWTSILDCVAIVDDAAGGDQIYCATTIGPDPGGDPMGHIYLCAAWEFGAYDVIGGDDTPGADNPCGGGPVVATINELRIDQIGNDDDEYFELAGNPGDALDGLFYIVIGDGAAGSGVVESITDLTGSAIGAGGYFVAAEATFTLGVADLTTTLGFENSDNVTHLLVRDFTGMDQDDLDTDDDGILDVTPWSEVVDCIGLVEDPLGGDMIYCATTVGPDGVFVPGHAFFCDMLGWQIGTFDPVGTDDTPGADNDCSPDGAFEVYCVSFPNSFSVGGAKIGWTGTGNISDNDTVLTVADCPNSPGLFFFGDFEDLQIPFGNGALCVGGSITRWDPSVAANNTNGLALDFNGGGPEASFSAGDTKYIQYWYRDQGQGAENNTSDALKVTFGG